MKTLRTILIIVICLLAGWVSYWYGREDGPFWSLAGVVAIVGTGIFASVVKSLDMIVNNED